MLYYLVLYYIFKLLTLMRHTDSKLWFSLMKWNTYKVMKLLNDAWTGLVCVLFGHLLSLHDIHLYNILLKCVDKIFDNEIILHFGDTLHLIITNYFKFPIRSRDLMHSDILHLHQYLKNSLNFLFLVCLYLILAKCMAKFPPLFLYLSISIKSDYPFAQSIVELTS